MRLFVLAGHRNMEGERAFASDLGRRNWRTSGIAFRQHLGAGHVISDEWEALSPSGAFGTFGPEMSFGETVAKKTRGDVAIAKFTDGGSQMIDWTPEGSPAEARHVYPTFIAFVRDAVRDLEVRGHTVELSGVFYHMGENDMAYGPYRRTAAQRLASLVSGTRETLGAPQLDWYVSQQAPPTHDGLDRIDVTSEVASLAADDPHLVHLKAFDLPGRDRMVLSAEGVVALGNAMARAYLDRLP